MAARMITSFMLHNRASLITSFQPPLISSQNNGLQRSTFPNHCKITPPFSLPLPLIVPSPPQPMAVILSTHYWWDVCILTGSSSSTTITAGVEGLGPLRLTQPALPVDARVFCLPFCWGFEKLWARVVCFCVREGFFRDLGCLSIEASSFRILSVHLQYTEPTCWLSV